MITINNYQELKNSINWSELPKQIRENRDEVESIMEFYDDDNDIKEAVDLFFKGINDNISKNYETKAIGFDNKEIKFSSDKNKFNIGDYVEVISGTEKGAKGKVVEDLGENYEVELFRGEDDDTEFVELWGMILKKINKPYNTKTKPIANQKKSDIPKTLAAFKKWAKENIGHVLYLVGKYGERIDYVTREVEVPQSNAIGFKTERNTTSWIQFGKSSEWEFTDKYARWTEPSGYTVLTYYYDKPKNWGQEQKQNKEETISDTLKNSKNLLHVMPKMQQEVLKEYEKSEEKEYFINLLKDLDKDFEISKKRQDKNLKDSVVRAHYFYGSSDWYILDYDHKNKEFFGYVILNGDVEMSEAGYISIAELMSVKALELDFYFDQDKLSNVLAKKYPSYFSKQEKEEAKQETKTKAAKVEHKIDAKFVDNFTVEFTLIRRFYNMIKSESEKQPFRKVQLLYNAFQKAAIERKVRKTSSDADIFNEVKAKITTLYKDFAEPTKADVYVEFQDKNLFDKIKDFAIGQKVNPVVTLLKSYISIQGTKPDTKKAASLLKRLKAAKEKYNSSDFERFKEHINNAVKSIENYIEKPKEKVEVSNYGLSRPKSVCNNRIKCEGIDKNGKLKKGYKFQENTGAVIRVSKKKSNSKKKLASPIIEDSDYVEKIIIVGNNNAVPVTLENYSCSVSSTTENNNSFENKLSLRSIKERKENEERENLMNQSGLEEKNNQKISSGAKRLLQSNFDVLPINEEWSQLMQNPAANLKIAIWGKPKNGKTSGALQLAEYFTNFGKVLYNFADQGFNLSTRELWINSGLAENSNAEPSDIDTLDELEKEIASGNYRFVFIDMISDYIRKEKLKPEEFKERFIKRYPNVSFILIFEVTKSGDFKGDQGWTHVVDAIMTVENFLMENRGRYGMGERIIWEEGFAKFNPKRYQELMEEKQNENMNSAPVEKIVIN